MIAARTKDTRTPLTAEPALPPGGEWWLRAFSDLDTCRIFSDGAFGPIPWTAIHAYAGAKGLASDAEESFTSVVRAIDAAWLEAQRRLSDEKRPRPPTPPAPAEEG